MRCRLPFVLALVIGLLGFAERAYPCAALRANARIDTFSCMGCDGNLETQIYSVSGTAVISSAHAAPVLGSLVVEIQARQDNGSYIPAARQVVNAFGASSVSTCVGTLLAGPFPGKIVFVDKDGNELSFDSVKNISSGTNALNFIATFVGTIPELDPGERARVRVYTTAMNVDTNDLCSVDADGDGSIDTKVKTLIFRKLVRVPSTAFLLSP